MKALLIALTSLFLSCAPGTRELNVFEGVKQGDLAPRTATLLDQYQNRFYAIPGDAKTDLYVLILRSNLLQRPGSREPIKAVLSLGSLRDKPDCSVIRAKVGNKKLEDARNILDGAFYCFDSLATEEEILAENPMLSSDSINWPVFVDAHVGWYAATGDRRPVEKLVRNLALNEQSCPCIPWPLSSVAVEDSLFRTYVREEAAKYPDNERIRKLLDRMNE